MPCQYQGITKSIRFSISHLGKAAPWFALRSCHLNLGHMLQALSVSCELHGWIMEEGGIRQVFLGPFPSLVGE